MPDDGHILRRDLARAKADLRALAAVVARHTTHITDIVEALPAITAQSERFGALLDPLAVGFTTIPVEWPNPFPDTAYMVTTELSVPVANMGVVFASAGAKTTTGCTVVVRSLAAVPITVVLDVLGIRT